MERISGDAPPNFLIEPKWCLEKSSLRISIEAEFRRRGTQSRGSHTETPHVMPQDRHSAPDNTPQSIRDQIEKRGRLPVLKMESLKSTWTNSLTRRSRRPQRDSASGGIPIGSVLVLDGTIVGRGHNQRVQKASAVLHAEMDAIENAGRLSAAEYRRCILYSTLSPCDMCSGAALLYGIPKIVVGENETFCGPERVCPVTRRCIWRSSDDPRCIDLMRQFINQQPELWNEDIGV